MAAVCRRGKASPRRAVGTLIQVIPSRPCASPPIQQRQPRRRCEIVPLSSPRREVEAIRPERRDRRRSGIRLPRRPHGRCGHDPGTGADRHDRRRRHARPATRPGDGGGRGRARNRSGGTGPGKGRRPGRAGLRQHPAHRPHPEPRTDPTVARRRRGQRWHGHGWHGHRGHHRQYRWVGNRCGDGCRPDARETRTGAGAPR